MGGSAGRRGKTLPVGLALAAFVFGTAAWASPPLAWVGAKRVAVACIIQSETGTDTALSKKICTRARTLVAEDAPLPTVSTQVGDPVMLDAGTVTLLIQGSVTRHRGERLLAFNMRPFRASIPQSEVLLGAAPRLASLAPSARGQLELEAALDAALSDVLPWRARPETRPIP